jgi:hypothetical protein
MNHRGSRAWLSIAVFALAPTTVSAQTSDAPIEVAVDPAAAPAASEPPVVVDVASSAAIAQPEAIRTQIAQELRAPVITPSSAVSANSPRGTLVIFVTPDRRLTVRWTAASGAQLERSVPAPTDPIEFVRTIGMLAANLAQDPLADLLPPRAAQQVAPAPVQVNIVLQPLAVTPLPPPPVALALQPVMVRAPVVAAAPQPEDWRARRQRQTVSFGFDSYSSFGTSNSSDVSIGSIFVNRHVRPWLRVGVGQITGGMTPTGRGGFVTASPYAELVWAPLQWFEGFAQLGIGLQGRFADRSSLSRSGFALDASATIGGRFRIGHVFSLGLGLRGASSIINDFYYGHAPRQSAAGGAIIGAGLEMAWTVGG